jgi:hypothetical protein
MLLIATIKVSCSLMSSLLSCQVSAPSHLYLRRSYNFITQKSKKKTHQQRTLLVEPLCLNLLNLQLILEVCGGYYNTPELITENVWQADLPFAFLPSTLYFVSCCRERINEENMII